jgi:hypothetical protein
LVLQGPPATLGNLVLNRPYPLFVDNYVVSAVFHKLIDPTALRTCVEEAGQHESNEYADEHGQYKFETTVEAFESRGAAFV